MTSSSLGAQTGRFVIVVALLVLGFGLATLGWVDHATTSEVIHDAEQTEVTILESELSEPGGETTGDQSYSITVVYEYGVDGQTYRSSSIHPGISDHSYSRRSRANAVIQKYPEGETATGYVDTTDPERVYLEHPSVADQIENNLHNSAVTAVGTILFLISAIGAVRTAAGIEQ